MSTESNDIQEQPASQVAADPTLVEGGPASFVAPTLAGCVEASPGHFSAASGSKATKRPFGEASDGRHSQRPDQGKSYAIVLVAAKSRNPFLMNVATVGAFRRVSGEYFTG